MKPIERKHVPVQDIGKAKEAVTANKRVGTMVIFSRIIRSRFWTSGASKCYIRSITLKSYFKNLSFKLYFTDVNKCYRFVYNLKKTVTEYQYGFLVWNFYLTSKNIYIFINFQVCLHFMNVNKQWSIF